MAEATDSTKKAEGKRLLKIQSSCAVTFDVDADVMKLSNTINTMLQDLDIGADGDTDQPEPIPLNNVKAAILKKVIEWCEYHKDMTPPTDNDTNNADTRTDEISSWDAEFLNVDQGTLFEIILAANYLDIKGLVNVACKHVANMMKGKTPEQIRNTFNLEDDFTPEQREEIKKESAWWED